MLDDDLARMAHSRRMQQQLDESCHMLDMLTESLSMDFTKNQPTLSRSSAQGRQPLTHSTSKDSSVFSEIEEQEHMDRVHNAAANGEVRRRSRTQSENATRSQLISSLSTSEPDMANLDDDDTPPPLPPRDPDMLAPATPSHDLRTHDSLVGNRMIRGSSEHSLLTTSLNIGSTTRSPFHHGNAMLISPAHQTRSALSTPERRRFSSTKEQSGSQKPLPGGGKKSNTFGRYSPVQPGDLPETAKSPRKEKTKSRWSGLKDKVNKKFKRSPSMEAKEMQGFPRESRSQSIPSVRRNNIIAPRKTSVGPEVKLSVAVDVPDSGALSPARRQRKTSSSHVQGLAVNTVTLISKIFNVLGCWQENYFEVGVVT